MRKAINGYEGLFEIDEQGNVFRLAGVIPHSYKGKMTLKERKLTIKKTEKGYLAVRLTKQQNTKEFKVHRLIATAFIHNPENLAEVNHKNGIKTDNRVENLEWCTHKENIAHAWKNGLSKAKKGENHGRAKLTKLSVLVIKEALLSGHKQTAISKYFNVGQQAISRIKTGKSWQ